MEKQSWWKRELKEMLAIASVFFVIFLIFMLMKKAVLNQYTMDFYAISTALVGSLIIAKIVLILDMLAVTKKTDHLPNIYRVFFRSFVYLLGYAIMTFLEHLIKALFHKVGFVEAANSAFHELTTVTFFTTAVGLFFTFLFFNAFWVIRAKYGPDALYSLFFKENSK